MPLSPMMKHYLETKQRCPNAILFYRLGDFYEMFFEDAIVASRELDLTLTGRDCGQAERAPMCGVPYHAVEGYIAKLIAKGYNVAICEQLTEPKPGVKMVERDIVRVITPGTVMEKNMLVDKANNYIASIYVEDNSFGYSYLDMSTGEFYVSMFSGDNYLQNLNDLLVTSMPKEIICNSKTMDIANEMLAVKSMQLPHFQQLDDSYFNLEVCHKTLVNQFGNDYIKKIDKTERLVLIAAGSILQYVYTNSMRDLRHIKMFEYVSSTEYMSLDMNTRRNLELTETLYDHKKRGSILWLLDKTETAMGGRMLNSWIDMPLYSESKINARLKGVGSLVDNIYVRQSLIESIGGVYDIERLCGRLSFGSFSPKDCIALSNSLKKLPEIKSQIENISTPIIRNIFTKLYDYSDIIELINKAIVDDPPMVLKEGGYIKKGYNKELDDVLDIGNVGKTWLAELESKEKEKTGIAKLRIGYNRVFGYYLEVPRSQSELIPFEYHRKQTTANCERFITDELKQIEEKILGADEKRLELEQQLFNEIREHLSKYISKLQETSKAIATLDCLLSLARVACEHNYVMPTVSSKLHHIKIVDGRHPVVEALLKDEDFVPNDTLLDDNENRTMIITGPNMAGKSTYMRQVAVITLLAHIGSFVPAKSAEIALTDKIFTRVGASDNLAFGQSTFMIEMLEVSNILKNATNNSLLILDEVGRGTSTFDGLSIAWSVMEYIANHLLSKTLFATHYHELTDLEGKLDGVKNYRISIKEFNNSVIFLRKIVRGGANKSFGIEVASLAGLPQEVITRAREILHQLEQHSLASNFGVIDENTLKENKTNKIANEIYNYLKDINVDNMTPLGAFDTLVNLVEKVKK